jgi:hypothetical protein
MLNSPSAMMLFFLILAMISPAKAQIVTCDSSSPQCCWFVRINQLMGLNTSISSTSTTACCNSGVPGSSLAICSGSTITELYFWGNKLTGSIPPEIGNLVNLQWL